MIPNTAEAMELDAQEQMAADVAQDEDLAIEELAFPAIREQANAMSCD